jgi:hypothetical protein
MTLPEISYFRLINHQIAASKFTTAKEIVDWMGAVQSQDYPMSKWAIGLRLPGSTESMIESALDKGEIFRTHALRPTWHLVSADDIHALLELSATQIKASMQSRDKQLGLTDSVFRKSQEVLLTNLQNERHLTRDELVSVLINAGFDLSENRTSHLLMRAEIDGIICSGKIRDGKLTYALLSERVPYSGTFNRDLACTELARRYFRSHGPATLNDFVWWSGLSKGQSKKALETIKTEFVSETIENQTYWFSSDIQSFEPENNTIHFVPAFDEFIISYRDRKASLPFENMAQAVSVNGIFKPVIVINGQVEGTWKRTVKKNIIILETLFFSPISKSVKNQLEEALMPYGQFFDKNIEIVHC